MCSEINTTALIAEMKRYLLWEKESYENWENIEIVIASNLSEAWIKARPQDQHKFDDTEFKQKVDCSNGKWLEKQTEGDKYKVILATKNVHSLCDLTKSLVHEIRHCLDYQNAVENLSFDEYDCGNEYYNNWSEFRAVYAHTRYEYFERCHSNISFTAKFNSLSQILGKSSADAVMGLMLSEDISDTLYYISRYIGASRAIRNINMEEQLEADCFNLWNMTPQYIIENYGYVFYIGNEWDALDSCELHGISKTYYNKLLDKIMETMSK